MAKLRKAKENIVQPVIKEDGKKHVFERMFEGDQTAMPTLKSVGYAEVPGTGRYVSYVLTTKGKDVLLIEVDDPNALAIAEESAKTSFVTQLMGQGV